MYLLITTDCRRIAGPLHLLNIDDDATFLRPSNHHHLLFVPHGINQRDRERADPDGKRPINKSNVFTRGAGISCSSCSFVDEDSLVAGLNFSQIISTPIPIDFELFNR